MSTTPRQQELAVQAAVARLQFWSNPSSVPIPRLVDVARETASWLGLGADDHAGIVNAILVHLVPRYAPKDVLHGIAKHALEKLEVKHG